MAQHVTNLPLTRPALQRELRFSGGRNIPLPKQGQRWPRTGYRIWWKPAPAMQRLPTHLVGLSQTGDGRWTGVIRVRSGPIAVTYDSVPLAEIRRRRWWSR